jgi:hypothetical protein
MTLRTVPSERDVRTRSTGFRVDLGTRNVTICMESRSLQEGVGGKRFSLSADCGGGGQGNSEQKKKAFSMIFTTDTKSFIHVRTCSTAFRVDLGTRYVTVCVWCLACYVTVCVEQ